MVTVANRLLDLFTGGLEWAGLLVNVIVTNPLILAFGILTFVGLAVGLIRRIMDL